MARLPRGVRRPGYGTVQVVLLAQSHAQLAVLVIRPIIRSRVPPGHQERTAASESYRSLTCSNDRERPRCQEFASRGSSGKAWDHFGTTRHASDRTSRMSVSTPNALPMQPGGPAQTPTLMSWGSRGPAATSVQHVNTATLMAKLGQQWQPSPPDLQGRPHRPTWR